MAEETKTVVTERASMTTDRQLSRVTVVSMPAWQIVLVRAARVYLQTLTGALGATYTGLASGVGLSMTAGDFMGTFLTCATVSLAPALMSVLMNTYELLTKLDATNPSLRA